MILKPIKKDLSIYLLSKHINMWLLRYLSKQQDRIKSLNYVSGNNVLSINEDPFEINHLYRRETKAALSVAVNSFNDSEKLSFVGIKDYRKVFTQSLMNEDVPILIVDEYTDKQLLSLMTYIKKEAVIIEVSKQNVVIIAKDERGNIIPGYDCSLIEKENLYINNDFLTDKNELMNEYKVNNENLSHVDKIMLSSIVFMIINKLIAGEALLTNVYTANTSDISIIRK